MSKAKSHSEKMEKIADELLKAGEKRGADEILGVNTERLSPSKLRSMLRKKGVLKKAKGGLIAARNFKGIF
jgi:hypothetical protein|tara:strand:+ start:2569 stop:2781 length:213 start_codon:yes stop_codon:yes gene_type:complete